MSPSRLRPLAPVSLLFLLAARPGSAGAQPASEPAPPATGPAATLAPPPAEPAPPAPEPAPPPADGDDAAPVRISEMTVVGTREKQTAGSAHILKSEELERQDQDDPHQVLRQVPGVYSRGEDGFGLRPNIGIRGVSPDRSKKVTLMEDGVLFAPAPYSAPAAYYFPLITRMESVRVIKGPGAVSFGPQTVGGAIDLVTRRIPGRTEAGIDLGLGQFGYGKVHGYLGGSTRRFGALLEVVNLQSSGWKELDGGGDTGFRRQEAMGKLRFVPVPGARIDNSLELKLGLSRERSDETYLGLSDEDLRANPRRRYAASRLDHMKWWRTQLSLRHVLDFGGGRKVETTVYRHDFDRTWNKVNRVGVGNIAEVLRAPTSPLNALGYKVLTLAPDAPGDVALYIGPNHRDFVSQGVQSVADLRFDGARLSHRLELGARLHYDRIDRRHTEDAYFAVAGQLQRGATATAVTADNRGRSNALALHALDAVTVGRLTLTPGLRFELIRTRFKDRRTGAAVETNWQNVIIPGLGGYYALHPALGLLAGVYRGFSPAAPGEGEGQPRAETSWNYEAGLRASGRAGRAEAIAFFNDYRNLVGVCGIGGCAPEQVDQQFNAGKARIWGFELFGQRSWRPMSGLNLPASANYTFTRTRLGSSFTSGLAELGTVEVGDEIAYVPRHQAALSLAAETAHVGLQASLAYVSRMREEAGQGAYVPALTTDGSLVAEVGARVYLLSRTHIYVHVRNLTDQADVAARRPFGARPISPRWIQLGVKSHY